MRDLTFMVRKLVTKYWVHVTLGLVSKGGKKGWEAVEITYTFFGNCCWEVQMRKNSVAIKTRSSL